MTLSEMSQLLNNFYLWYSIGSVALSIIAGLFNPSEKVSFLTGLAFGNGIGMLISIAMDPYNSPLFFLMGGMVSLYFSGSWIWMAMKYSKRKVKQSDDIMEEDIL